jgi:hypothetical protein
MIREQFSEEMEVRDDTEVDCNSEVCPISELHLFWGLI